MKLTNLLLLVTVINVFGGNAYSQFTEITLDVKDSSLQSVLNQIEDQSGFFFLYSSKMIDVDQRVDINVYKKNMPLVLDELFADTGIRYNIKDRQVLLVNEDALGVDSNQQKRVTGRVTGPDNIPLPGVAIVVKGSSVGVFSDANGNFSLELPENAKTLSFSFVGMTPLDIEIGDRTLFNVQMSESNIALDEVVVIGYGTIGKRDLTGSISTVDATNISKIKVSQLSQALQGSMSGVMITRNSSLPGASAAIRIRGITTIGDSNPLIVVDGIPVGNIDDINPNDIANISVLKDAASASIYGARAAAGVILITTKSAESGQLNLEYDVSYGFERITEYPEVVGPRRYLEMTNELYWNDAGNLPGGEFPLYTEDEVNNWETYNKTDPNEYPVTDWRAIIMNDYAPRQRHQLSFALGNENIKSRASLNYEKTAALYDYCNFDRVTVRINNEIKINDYLTSFVDFAYNHSLSKNPQVSPVQHLIRYAPIYGAFYEDGRISGGKDGSNVYAMLHYGGFDNTTGDKINGKISLQLKPFKNLTVTGVVSPYFGFQKRKDFTKKIPYYSADDPTQLEGYIEGYNRTELYEYRNDEKTLTKQLFANYSQVIGGDHQLDLMAGYEDFSFFSESLRASSTNYILSGFPYLDLGPLDFMSNTGSAIESAYQSYFGRLNYSFKSRYILQANVRHDGSSRFHPDYRWSTFPSVSAGWVISEESFMKNVPAISFLKLRGSWGNLGNERIGYYPYQATIAYNNVLFFQGSNVVSTSTAAQIDYAIEDISWETTETWGMGLDINLFNEKLRISGDYYSKKTKDMLLELEIPDYMGFDNPNQNTGIMYTKGWEVLLNWNDHFGEFNYSLSFNISDFKSKMGDLGGIVFLGDQIIREGSEYMEWYGYLSDGLFQTQQEVDESPKLHPSLRAGDIKYIDVSGPEDTTDDAITPTYDKVLLGGSLPRYLFGGTINLEYKSFDFSLLFQGVGKQNSRIIPQMVRSHYSWWTVPPKLIDGKYWSAYNTEEQNLNAIYPRVSYIGAENNNYEMSDYWIFNGAYFRVKNITLGYTLPHSLTNKVQLEDVRVYTSITDPLSFDKYPKGWDPEATYTTYISKTFNFGLSVKF